MDDRTEAEIRNAALEEAALLMEATGKHIAASDIRAKKNDPAGQASSRCWCQTCRPITLTDMRMVLCPDCGNKRCPHANDHRNACTGSNEPGQPGSAYPAAQAPAKGADVVLPPLPRLIPVEHFEKQQAMWDYARAAVLADRQQRGGDVDERAMFDQWFCQHSELPMDADTTQYDEAFLAYAAWQARAALAASNAGSTEKLLRFCPSCGMLGDLPAGSSYLACCPDHGDARVVPAKFARQCKQLFSDALSATKGESNE